MLYCWMLIQMNGVDGLLAARSATSASELASSAAVFGIGVFHGLASLKGLQAPVDGPDPPTPLLLPPAPMDPPLPGDPPAPDPPVPSEEPPLPPDDPPVPDGVPPPPAVTPAVQPSGPRPPA